jgi:uncharacterized membrane protein YdbT with pleckstrin-like domain
LLQLLDRLLRFVALDEVERVAEQYDGDDDPSLSLLALPVRTKTPTNLL